MLYPNVVKVREKLSPKQRRNLITKIDSSGFFETSRLKLFGFIPFGWRVNVKNIKEEHPKNFWGSYLPIGFIGFNYAEIVNSDVTFPEDYYSQFVKICDSV